MNIIIPERDIQNAVKEIAAIISSEYDRVTLIVILSGAFVFASDLARAISVPVKVGFMSLSSYGKGKLSSGMPRIELDLKMSIKGEDCYIVEDIVDTGHTLYYLKKILEIRKPASLKICTFLDKYDMRERELILDHVGYGIRDNPFLVGYGLDFNEDYRNLSYVAEIT